MKVLVTGAGGQLGRALVAAAPAGADVTALDRGHLDIADGAAVASCVASLRPDIVVNAAAWTAVDAAEREAAAAYAANRDGPEQLARALREGGGRLVHVSTDYVFDGRAAAPRRPDDPTHPVGTYGASKLAGERAVRCVLGTRACVVRTAWVYDATGRNFVNTMLALMQAGRDLSVVADQIGTPTSAASLAAALWRVCAGDVFGEILHFTDAGAASWYDFAVAIQEEALALGLLRRPVAIRPVRTVDYPTLAARPAASLLDCTTTRVRLGLEPVHWREALRRCLRERVDG